jgi:hypothetical protein
MRRLPLARAGQLALCVAGMACAPGRGPTTAVLPVTTREIRQNADAAVTAARPKGLQLEGGAHRIVVRAPARGTSTPSGCRLDQRTSAARLVGNTIELPTDYRSDAAALPRSRGIVSFQRGGMAADGAGGLCFVMAESTIGKLAPGVYTVRVGTTNDYLSERALVDSVVVTQ